VRFGWPDLVGDARAGAFDLAAGGITVRSDRSIVGTFGVPLAESGAVVLVADGSELELESLDSAAIRIAVNRGGHLERVARSRFPLAETLPTSPNAAVPGRLARGEVDAIVTAPLDSAGHMVAIEERYIDTVVLPGNSAIDHVPVGDHIKTAITRLNHDAGSFGRACLIADYDQDIGANRPPDEIRSVR